MSEIANRTVLITGASSGIGAAAARHLAGLGARVVLGARRTEQLETLSGEIAAAGGNAAFRRLDVTDLADFQAFTSFAEQTFGPVDVLVSNAGVMPLSPLSALKVDEWAQMIDVNITGVLNGIAAVLPGMEARGSGHIVNVASVAGIRVMPTGAVYCATKFAVRAISEGLRQESDKIRSTIISPGAVESELAQTITHAETRDWVEEVRKGALKADAIARAIAYAIAQPADVDVGEVVVRPTATTW